MSDLLIIMILILISALFAMSEIAIAASRKIKLRVMVDEGNKKAQAVLSLQEQPGAFFCHDTNCPQRNCHFRWYCW